MSYRYQRIEMDPPWNESGGGGRGAQNHYPLIKKRGDIYSAIRDARFENGEAAWRPDLAQSHLWMWVTNNFLPDGLWLMSMLGYRYVTNAVWTKPRFGLGQYLRGKHEPCLFGVRGRTLLTKPSLPSQFGGRDLPHPTDESGKIIHSAKPHECLATMEAVSPAEHALEMFARSERPGVDSWGNETNSQEQGQMCLVENTE